MSGTMSNFYRITQTISELQDIGAEVKYDGDMEALGEISGLLDILRGSIRYIAPDFNGYVETYLEDAQIERIRQLVNRDLDLDNQFEMPAPEPMSSFLSKPQDYTFTHSYMTLDEFGNTIVDTTIYAGSLEDCQLGIQAELDHPGGGSGTTISLTLVRTPRAIM